MNCPFTCRHVMTFCGLETGALSSSNVCAPSEKELEEILGSFSDLSEMSNSDNDICYIDASESSECDFSPAVHP
jgi:hypothetical protein